MRIHRRVISVVLAALAVGGCDAADDRPPLPVRPRPVEDPRALARARPLPEPGGPARGASRSLLEAMRDLKLPITPEGRATWTLPAKAEAMAASLVKAAAMDDLHALYELLTADAGWGLPTRRELERRPIRGPVEGPVFMDELRYAASRLPEMAARITVPGGHEVSQLWRVGSEPLWAGYVATDEHTGTEEAIVIKLVVVDGTPKVDYVGLWGRKGARPAALAGGPGQLEPPLVPELRAAGAMLSALPADPRLSIDHVPQAVSRERAMAGPELAPGRR